MFRGKKYKESAKLIDRSVQYDPTEALDLVVKGASAKFDETVEIHIKLGVDSRHADQQVRGAVVLPNGTGKTRRVLVFAKDAKVAEAKEAGADFDVNGPTAVIKSCAKMDHLATAGTLLNQKFTPDVVAGEKGLENMASLIRSYFAMDGHHVQFNVIDRQTLIEAQKHPDDYRDLIVRVAGYSDFFRNLSKPLQDEIINRTEQSFE